MKQYTEKHYDDDLTVVEDEYNDSFHTDSVDLFEFPSNDESPIARLKSLVLSIDWEITDDILRQFNEELVDLKDVWADEKIYLVYVQALEKISKYIYQEKADSNPNAIKLLLTFFYNLEKMVSSEFMSEEEKRQIVLEDVKKFEMLKRQIGRAQNEARMTSGEIHVDEMQPRHGFQPQEPDPILLDLKAIVLGMDWEITEKDLEKLRDEVVRLEEVFAGSRPKLIFLQGLGSLAAYIRLKKSDAHADAFKLLHSFFAGLERIVTIPMSVEEEKAVLLPEVEKFKAFKAVVASTISPEVKPTAVEVDEEEEDDEEYESGGRLTPALSDLPEGEARGFREEDEAVALGLSPALAVTSQIDKFFAESPEEEQAPAFEEKLQRIEKDAGEAFRDATEAHLDSLFQLDADEKVSFVPHVDQEFALQGVDVETEADDDSEEAGLPFAAGQPAPALAAMDEDFPAGWKMPEKETGQAALPGDVAQRVDDLFGEDISGQESDLTSSPALPEEEEEVLVETSVAFLTEEFAASGETGALQGVDVETDDDDYAGGDLAPAFADVPISGPGWQAQTVEEGAEEPLILSEPAPALYDQGREGSGRAGWMSEQDESVASLEDHLDSFFEFEEEKEFPESTEQTLSSTEEMPGVKPFKETISEAIGDRIEEVAGIPEEYPDLTEAPALAETPPEEPVAEAPSFEMEALEGENAPATAAAQLIAVGEEAEQDIVFDLAGDEEELFADPYAEENRVEPVTPEQELTAAEVQDIPDIFQEAPESAEEVEEQPGYSAVTFPETEVTPQEDEEFLAVFEEADETAAEEVWPDRVAAGIAQPVPEEAVAADLEEKPESAPAVDEITGDQDLFFEEGGPFSAPEDPLANLRACVSSVGIELENSIFKGIYTEINELRSRWATHPLEKSFLQLVSTITQHIDQYRYESSSEAFSLFQSVVDAFGEALEWHHPAAAQEILLKEMTKVLLWQQSMLTRQAVTKGDELTFAAPIRHQPGESSAEDEISFAEEESENVFPEVLGGAGEDRAVDEDLTVMVGEFPIEKDIWFSTADAISPNLDQGLAGESATVEDLADAETADSEMLAMLEEKIAAEPGPLAEYDSDILEEEIRLSSDTLYSELEAVLAGERLASSGGDGDAADDAALAGKIRALMQDEFTLIRQEMQSQVEALRRELKGREG